MVFLVNYTYSDMFFRAVTVGAVQGFESMRWLRRVFSVKFLIVITILLLLTLLLNNTVPPACDKHAGSFDLPDGKKELYYKPGEVVMNTVTKLGNKTFQRDSEVIFVGGMPRSGTTLMRVILDAHPFVLCGEETRVVPRILQMRQQWTKSKVESTRLFEAGITNEVLDAATAAFIIEILAKHASKHEKSILCDKDPFNLKNTLYLDGLFPKAKFLLMLRDGRATSHSIITRKVTISGFDITSYRDVLTKWNRAIGEMYNQCMEVGPSRCMPVWYEQLVLQPNKTVHEIISFLDVPWNDMVLHHQDAINKTISISKVERSTDQVAKPVNLDGLTSWVGHIPPDVERDMGIIAPMLAKLGYDPSDRNPSYGEPDELVKANQRLISEHPELFKVDTYRVDKAGKFSRGQPGQDEMHARQQEKELNPVL